MGPLGRSLRSRGPSLLTNAGARYCACRALDRKGPTNAHPHLGGPPGSSHVPPRAIASCDPRRTDVLEALTAQAAATEAEFVLYQRSEMGLEAATYSTSGASGSIGERLVSAIVNRDGAIDAGGRTDIDVEVPMGAIESGRRAVEWGSGGPGSGFPAATNYDATNAGSLLPLASPLAPTPRQARLWLRDLLPSMKTVLPQIPYVQELNPTASESASAVAEGGTKPNATIDFDGKNAIPTVLATTLVVSKQLFEDSPLLVQYLNQRLPYMVRFKEDQEFLTGSGNWPDIEGFLNTSGVQSQDFTDDIATTIANAIGKIEAADGVPGAVIGNPLDLWPNMFAHRASSSGVFDFFPSGAPAASSGMPLTIWGVPTYRTPGHRHCAGHEALKHDRGP